MESGVGGSWAVGIAGFDRPERYTGAMTQFGSDTVIGHSTAMLICDCFDTLVAPAEGGHQARIGIPAFLRYYQDRGVIIIVHSDGQRRLVKRALSEAGLLGSVERIYHADNGMRSDVDHPLPLKDLQKPLQDYGVAARDAVFIGDSPLDGEAARLADVPFIRVPRSEDPDFSFTSLISGPSRYRSTVFRERVWNLR